MLMRAMEMMMWSKHDKTKITPKQCYSLVFRLQMYRGSESTSFKTVIFLKIHEDSITNLNCSVAALLYACK